MLPIRHARPRGIYDLLSKWTNIKNDDEDMTTLVICTTCGFQQDQLNAQRPGARLADLVEAALANGPSSEAGVARARSSEQTRLRMQRTKCLMACERACSAAVHQSGKYSYVFGDLRPDADSVAALLSYVQNYRDSATGVVAYQHWPEGIKGHFVARIPPLQQLTESE